MVEMLESLEMSSDRVLSKLLSTGRLFSFGRDGLHAKTTH